MFDKLGIPAPAVQMMLHKMGMQQRSVAPGADLESVLSEVNDAAFKTGASVDVIRGNLNGRSVILFAVIGAEK
jgi:hypothetical protein